MNIKNLLLLICIPLLLAGLVSCADENNQLRLSISESKIDLPIGGSYSYTIYGGNGNCTVSSDNNSVAYPSIVDGNKLFIQTNQKGTAVIVVSDAENTKITLTVQVVDKQETFQITQLEVSVAVPDQDIKKSIEDDLQKGFPIPVGGKYKMVYNEPLSGTLFIYPNENNDEVIEGTFVRKENSILVFKYNGKEFTYKLEATKSKSTNNTSLKILFTEDFTDYYQKVYNNTVTRALRAQILKVVN